MAVHQLAFQRSNTYEEALGRAAAECGIDRQYWDIFGHRHEASIDALKKILGALGCDISNTESIDAKRAQWFASLNTATLQQTIVLGDAECCVTLTLPDHFRPAIQYEVVLESGERINGHTGVAQLALLREIRFRWPPLVRLPATTFGALAFGLSLSFGDTRSACRSPCESDCLS